MNADPLPITDALEMARSEPEDVFSERLGHGVLVGTPPLSDEPKAWSYHTRALRGTFSRAAPGIDLKGARVYPLKKTQQRFADTILIGRSESNDVRVDEDSISKLHARVRIDGDQMIISDAGSKNGIEINYKPLFSGEHPLRDGDVVTLGHYTFRFYRPAELYRMLRAVS